MSKSSNAPASVPTDSKIVAREVRELLADLTAAAAAKDSREGKRIRRALRARGHRGGLRNAPAPAPTAKRKGKRNANAA